jgi:hypothetical protein
MAWVSALSGIIIDMLLAYIDEIGEPGAFVSKEHDRFNTSPAFGYAGFVIPASEARHFGSIFTEEKRRVFKQDLERAGNPAQWERKGSSIFRPDTPDSYPQQIRVFRALVRKVVSLGGMLFYYADEKPLGTPKQTTLDAEVRERDAMRETLNRLCTFAENRNMNLMVMIDQINESTRAHRIPNMYGHILSRAAAREEMKRVIEPPMHVDSILSANIQFADWIAAAVTRAIEYHTIQNSPYAWVTRELGDTMNRSFTFESKLHLWSRSVDDINHSLVFHRERPLFPQVSGQRLGDIQPGLLQKIHAAAVRAENKEPRRR